LTCCCRHRCQLDHQHQCLLLLLLLLLSQPWEMHHHALLLLQLLLDVFEFELASAAQQLLVQPQPV
jgi:hypothetical protein